MKKIFKNLLWVFAVMLACGIFTSCELLEKDEEKIENKDLFTDQIPMHQVKPESIEDETVKLTERPPVVNKDIEGFDQLDDVKEREKETTLPPFYKKYIKDKKEKIPIYLTVDAGSIHDIIPIFSDLLGFNFAIDPAVKGNITIRVQDPNSKSKELLLAPEDAWKLFEQILWMAGAYCSPEGEVLHIMPFQKMPRERSIFEQKGTASNIEVRIFDIHNLSAGIVLGQLGEFLTEGAKATELKGENAIMIVEVPENMRKLETLIKMLDNKRRTLWPRVIIRCSNVSSQRVVGELANILPILGFPVTIDKVVAEPGSIHLTSVERMNALIASAANKEALDEIIKWVSVLDRSDVGEQEQVFIYKVINSKADELVQSLASIFNIEGTSMSISGSAADSKASTKTIRSTTPKSSSKTKTEGAANIFEVPVKIFADGKNNRLITRTTPRTYAMIKALLARLDTIPAQVLLQIMIAEVRLNENTQFGVEFSGVSSDAGWDGTFGTNYTNLNPQLPSNNNERGFKYLISAGDDKYAYIRGLAATGNFKVLASPQLAAVSGTEASLDVGQEIPIVTKTISDTNSGTSALATSNEVEYKKTGVIMKITPQVTKGGLITIELDQTVSARGDNVAAGGSTYPSFINRQVITSLSMRDGATLLVGGIIQEEDRSTNDSLPLISKIPILAAALGFNEFDVTRTELLIMITASVIHADTKLEKMINRYKQSIKMIRDFNEEIKSSPKKKTSVEKEKT